MPRFEKADSPTEDSIPQVLDAAQASAMLGVSYDTFLEALRDETRPIAATSEPIDRPNGPVSRWQIDQRELRRVAEALNLTLRPWPSGGGKLPSRTSPAELLVTDTLMDAFATGPQGELAVAEAIPKIIAELDDDPAREQNVWRHQVTQWRAQHRGTLSKLPRRLLPESVGVWELLVFEACAVRLAVPSAQLITALLERKLATDDRPGSSTAVQVPNALLEAARRTTQMPVEQAVAVLLRRAIVGVDEV